VALTGLTGDNPTLKRPWIAADVLMVLLGQLRVRGIPRKGIACWPRHSAAAKTASLARRVERSLRVHEKSDNQAVETWGVWLAMFLS